MKRLFLPALFVLNFLHGYCQPQNKISVGFKAGYDHTVINARELNGSPSGFTGDQFYVGIFANKWLSNKINTEVEVSFSYADEYHFLELPFHIKYKIARKWAIFLGPRIDYITDSSEKYYYRFTKWGVSGEAGVQYAFSKRFFAETRYARSFTAQVDDLWLEFYNGKRNTFRVGLGVNF